MIPGLILVQPSPPPRLSGLSSEDRVAAMAAWWRRHYEDPRDTYRWDSEIGFLYPEGLGSCDIVNELGRAFPAATGEEIGAVAADVDEDDIGYWVPAQTQIRPEPPGLCPTLRDRLAMLGRDLDDVEAFIREQRDRPPPEGPQLEIEIEVPSDELERAASALDRVRPLLAVDLAAGVADREVFRAAEEALGVLGSRIRRILLRDACMAHGGGSWERSWTTLRERFRSVYEAAATLAMLSDQAGRLL